MSAAQFILASRSPRRAQLLREAGYVFEQIPSPFNDPPNPRMHSIADAKQLAMDLALQKAQALDQAGVIIGADTICVAEDGELLGTPIDGDEARTTLGSFVGNTHDVISGVAIIGANIDQPMLYVDVAPVTWGNIDGVTIDEYVTSGTWRGKAGGYNLFDRQAAGWPITVHPGADPTTVVGLPMRWLRSALAQIGISSESSEQGSVGGVRHG